MMSSDSEQETKDDMDEPEYGTVETELQGFVPYVHDENAQDFVYSPQAIQQQQQQLEEPDPQQGNLFHM